MTMLPTVAADTVGAARPLSILQIGVGWMPECSGGSENVFYHLAKYLPAAGVAVSGLVPGSAAVREQSGGDVEAFATRTAPLIERLWSERKAAIRHLAHHGPDLVAAHFSLFALPVLDLIGPRPLVVHFHGPWAAESAVEGARWLSIKTKAAIESIVYRRADRLIVLSQAFADILVRSYGIEPERIRIVPAGVDCTRFGISATRRDARERLGWEIDRPTILTVRRLARRMGLSELIASMVEVRRHVPELRLLIAGKGAEQSNLQRLIEELELTETVRLIGFVPDALLPWAYRAADLSVVPSTSLEGFGMITAESLAAGTPVLVTPVGGLPEAVRELCPQLVLAGSGRRELALGISGAVTGALKLPSSEQCRAYAHNRFDWPQIAAKTREVYLEALR